MVHTSIAMKRWQNITKNIAILNKMLSPTVIMVLHTQSDRFEFSKTIITVFEKLFGRTTTKRKKGIADSPLLRV